MAVFIISYDLRKPDRDYEPLYAALRKISAKHIQDSVWGVNSSSSAAVVFDYLWQHMHNASDRLFVVSFDKTEDYKANGSINQLNSL